MGVVAAQQGILNGRNERQQQQQQQQQGTWAPGWVACGMALQSQQLRSKLESIEIYLAFGIWHRLCIDLIEKADGASSMGARARACPSTSTTASRRKAQLAPSRLGQRRSYPQPAAGTSTRQRATTQHYRRRARIYHCPCLSSGAPFSLGLIFRARAFGLFSSLSRPRALSLSSPLSYFLLYSSSSSSSSSSSPWPSPFPLAELPSSPSPFAGSSSPSPSSSK